MKRNKYLFIIIAIPLIVTATLLISGCGKDAGHKAHNKALYYCPMHPTYTSDKPGDCPICNMKLVKKEEAAVKENSEGGKAAEEICIEHSCTMNNCPMTVRAGMKPGEKVVCPICGEYMTTTSGKLVEIRPGHAKGPTVMISPDRQQLIGIKTEPVKTMHLTKTIRASGKIAYDPELVVTQEEFIQALNNEYNTKDSPLQDVIDRAKSLTEAARKKLRLLGMSEEQITGLEKTRKADTSLYLPAGGENVWAYISVYEYEIGLVRKDADVDIEVPAYPGEKFKGIVRSIYPVLDPVTRTNQVRVEVANPESKLKPEMFANGAIKIDMGEKLAVPEAAVLDTGMRKIVYLSRPDGVLESQDVKLGQKAEGYYEVLSGIDEGDIVVTSGNFLVDSESRLKSALGGSEHQH